MRAPRPRAVPVPVHRLAILALLLVGLAMASISSSATAATGVSGQLENWEGIEFGAEPGQFFYGEGEPVGGFGADPVDGSTYVVSNTVNSGEARINKFTAAGVFEGSTAGIPRTAGSIGVKPAITGVAIDDSEHRVYVVESEYVSPGPGPFGEAFLAQTLLAYSTEVIGEELELEGSYSLPGATEAGAIFNPSELHADQTTGELVVSGINADDEPVLQRLSPVGEEGKSYVESGSSLKPGTFNAGFSFDIAADGTTFVIANSGGEAEGGAIEAFTLPVSFEPQAGPLALSPVPGFVAAGTAENWHQNADSFTAEINEGRWGPQFAVVTDPGGEQTLYWKAFSSQLEQSNIRIHGYSVQQEATTPAFGGGPEEPECAVEGRTTALAATTDGDLMVFDQGQTGGNLTTEPRWGPNVLRFGSGGGECPNPAPLIELKVGNQGVSTVAPGSSVTLDASGSEEGESTIESLVWSVEDPKGDVETVPVGAPDPLSPAAHTFTEEGTYTVRLKVKTASLLRSGGGGVIGDEFVAKPVTLVVAAGGPPAPTISAISPTKGPAPGGTEVTITGENLEAATVEFGSTEVTPLSDTATQITVDSPAGTPEAKVSVKVTTAGGGVTAGEEFEYEAAPVIPAPIISAVSPAKGPAAGGTTVTITGEHLASASAVEFGGVAGTVVSDTETQITVKSPAGAGGAKAAIEVTTPGGSVASTDEFEWEVVIKHKLTISKGGSGSGTVLCDGGACEAEYAVGATVTLTGMADSGSTFAGWSGGGCSGATPCAVVIGSADVAVGATFNQLPPSGGNPPGNGNPPSNPGNPPGNSTPPGGGGKKPPTAAQKLKEEHQKAIAKCQKLKGKAKPKCMKKADQIGKPKTKAKPKKKKTTTHELVQVVGRNVL